MDIKLIEKRESEIEIIFTPFDISIDIRRAMGTTAWLDLKKISLTIFWFFILESAPSAVPLLLYICNTLVSRLPVVE